MANDRRDFFKTVGVATAAAVLAKPAAAEAVAVTPAPVRYAPAYRHALVLDGVADELLGVDGGDVRGTVTSSTANTGSSTVLEKHISNISADNFTIALGAGQGPAVYAWMRQMTLRAAQSKSGSIVSGDSAGRARSQSDFTHAYITSLTFPALDVKDRSAAQILLTFSPESLQINRTPTTPSFGSKPKPWTCANFRLKIAGLEQSCAAVTAIEALTFRQEIPADQIGIFNEPIKNGLLPLKVPNLVLYCPEEFAGQFVDWHYDFLVRGNHLQANERQGSLEFLAPDRKTVYFTILLSQLGIYGCALEGEGMRTGANRRRKVEIYCETMVFGTGGLEPIDA